LVNTQHTVVKVVRFIAVLNICCLNIQFVVALTLGHKMEVLKSTNGYEFVG